MDFRLPTETVNVDDHTHKENTKGTKIKNFLFFTVVTFLAIILKSFLHTFVSLVGSFVGVFEIIIFPVSMILVINSNNRIMSNFNIFTLLIVSLIFAFLGFTSFILTFLHAFNSNG